MPPPPVDDHTEEFEQLAGLAALGVLEGDDQVRFEAHAAHCERCRVTVQLDREALALAAPEMEPSPDFKARLMQRAATELANTATTTTMGEAPGNVTPFAPPNVTPLRPPASADQPAASADQTAASADQPAARLDANLAAADAQPAEPGEAPQLAEAQDAEPPTRIAREPAKVLPFWRRSPWASAIAALLVVGIVTAGAYSYQNQVVATYALSGNLGGSAVVNVRRSGATELDMNGVQNPPPGYIYEAWIIPPNGQPVAAGTIQSGDASVPLAQIPDGSTVAVTQERNRVDAPTSAPIMAVVVQS